MLKTAEKLKLDKNKAKNKMVFRAYNSKGVDKNGAKCNMGFGHISKIYLDWTTDEKRKWSTCENAVCSKLSTRRRLRQRLQSFHAAVGGQGDK